MNNQQMAERVVELESRLAFQEDTIAQLNDVIASQSDDIQALQLQLRALANKFSDYMYDQSEGGAAPVQEKPPHY